MKIDTRKMLLAIMLFLGTVAKYTKTTLDDDFVSVVTDVLNNDDLYNIVDALIHNASVQTNIGDGRTQAIMAALPEKPQSLNAEKWLGFLGKASMLVRLLLTFAGQRTAAGSTQALMGST